MTWQDIIFPLFPLVMFGLIIAEFMSMVKRYDARRYGLMEYDSWGK